MMNVTDVHACYELQYEKKTRHKEMTNVKSASVLWHKDICDKRNMKRNVMKNRNDKCEKCKCVVALRCMRQKEM